MENCQAIRDNLSLEHIDVLWERIKVGWLQKDTMICRFVEKIKSLRSEDDLVEAEKIMVVIIFQGKNETTASKSGKGRKDGSKRKG